MDDDLRARVEALEKEVEMLKAWRPVQDAPAPVPLPASAPAPSPGLPPAKPAWHLGDAVANKAALENRIGGKWLAIAGITLLVVAIVFFFQLAVERGWIGLAGQIVLGVLLGLLLWAGGAFMAAKEKLTGFAQVVSAGGVAIAAFATFVGHHFETYQAATGLGLLTDSILLGVLGLGAALDAGLRRVPVQAATAAGLVAWTAIAGLDTTTFSLAYTVFMVAALLAVGVWRGWPWMAATAAPASAAVFIAHLVDESSFRLVLASAFIVHVLIVAAAFQLKRVDAGTIVGHVIAWASFWLLGGWAVVKLIDGGFFAWWSLGVAAVAFAASFAVKPRELRITAGIAGTVFAVAAPLFIEVEWARIPVWLALFAGAETLRRIKHWTTSLSVRPIILILIIGEAINAALGNIELRDGTWVLDLVALAIATGAGIVSWQGERSAEGVLRVPPAANLGIGLLIGLLATAALFTGPGPSMAWAVIAIGLVVAGFAFDEMQLRVSGLAVFAITLARIVVVDLAGVDAVWRVLAFIGIASLLLLASWLYVRNAAKDAAE